MTMGRGGNAFYLSRPHTLFSYTYSLPYPYPILIYLLVTLLIPFSDGFMCPPPIPIPQWIIFINKNKGIFQPRRNIVVMQYIVKGWWRSMTIMIKKREAKSVRCVRKKERTMISEYHLKDRDSRCMSEIV